MLAELSTIGIIIAIVVAIVASLLKRKQPDEEWQLPPELKPRGEQPPPKVSRWEEELRRVLEDRPLPPPVARPLPPPIPQFEEYEPHMQVELSVPAPQIEHTFQPLAGLTAATQRFAAAASLEQRVQQHMQTVTTHRVGTTSVLHTELAPELRELLTSLHQPRGMRAAVLASVILGPPRAFEI